MIGLILIILGALLLLVGLIGVAPQVKSHQIDAKSTFAGIFRAGGVMIIFGEMWGWFVTLDSAVITTAAIVGVANLFASLIIVTHERQQPGFKLKGSFSLQVFGLGVVIILLTLLLR